MTGGNLGRLTGVRLMMPDAARSDPTDGVTAATLAQLAKTWRDQGIVWTADQQRPDRWGRRFVHLTSDGTNLDTDFGLSLIKHGFAITWPSELPPNCRNQYLQAEETARRMDLGRWKHMQHKALDAGNGSDVATRAGQVALMQGRITHIGQTRRATYLNFGARAIGASAELGLSTWRDLERQGWTRDTLRGKIVRVRGVVGEGTPARLMLGDASALELVN